MAIFNSYVKLPEGNHWLKSAKYITPGAQVLITGASAGIGRDLALLLARQGANVALLARRGAAFAGGWWPRSIYGGLQKLEESQ